MKDIQIIYISDLTNEKMIYNSTGIYELIPVLDKYYKLKKRSFEAIKDNKYRNFDNLCIQISPDDQVTRNSYKNKIHTLKRITSETELYEKDIKNKKKISYGKYVVKIKNGDIKIVDSVLRNDIMSGKNPFQYIELDTEKTYEENDIIVGYPIKSIENIDVLRSEFIIKNKQILFDLLESSYKYSMQKKKVKSKIFKNKKRS